MNASDESPRGGRREIVATLAHAAAGLSVGTLVGVPAKLVWGCPWSVALWGIALSGLLAALLHVLRPIAPTSEAKRGLQAIACGMAVGALWWLLASPSFSLTIALLIGAGFALIHAGTFTFIQRPRD